MNKQLHRFEGMNFVKEFYAAKNMTDTAFAIYASEILDRPYSHAHIRQYRQVLEIPNSTAKEQPLPTTVYIVCNAKVAGVFLSKTAAYDLAGYEDDSMGVYEYPLLR